MFSKTLSVVKLPLQSDTYTLQDKLNVKKNALLGFEQI